MNLLLIIAAIAVITFVILYIASRNAHEVKDEEITLTKFQPRKVTVVVSDTTEKPKRKKKKYYNKKKKPAVANNTTTEKRPVGRPRKTAE